MGFISFVGRVLFASLFLLSAYQEYVPRSTLSSLTPQIPSPLISIDSAARRQIEAAPCDASPLVASFPICSGCPPRVRAASIEMRSMRCGDMS